MVLVLPEGHAISGFTVIPLALLALGVSAAVGVILRRSAVGRATATDPRTPVPLPTPDDQENRPQDSARSLATQRSVSLREIVNEMVEVADDETAYLNYETGELITLTDSERSALEEVGSSNDLVRRFGERLPEVREMIGAGHLLELPTRFDAREYSIRERFCNQISDSDRREMLLTAIRGPSAFRAFDKTIDTLGIRQQWHRARDEAFAALAIDWLESHGIGFDMDFVGSSHPKSQPLRKAS